MNRKNHILTIEIWTKNL